MEVSKTLAFDVNSLRQDFPTLHQEVYGRPLVYFDNGATAQKPKSVINTISKYYQEENANIHRGVHYLSQQATEAYEEARKTIQRFIKAEHSEEIIFTKGTTDGINLLAFSIGETLKGGDEILISGTEHHSNIVPWQMLCERKGCILKVIPFSTKGELDMEAFESLLSEKTKVLSVSHISNALGTIHPIERMIRAARKFDVQVVIDGAQAVQHQPVNVKELDCDYYVFSGHKVFGPTGIGILYGKKDRLNALPPYQGGGDMIAKVSFEKTTYNELPFKFEAGTPNIAGALGLAEALNYLNALDLDAWLKHEKDLLDHATTALSAIEGIQIVGTAINKASLVSFNIEGLHPFDVGTLLDKQGIAVRTGHHCAQPVMDQFEIPGTIRASFAFYNTYEEIDRFIAALQRSIEILK